MSSVVKNNLKYMYVVFVKRSSVQNIFFQKCLSAKTCFFAIFFRKTNNMFFGFFCFCEKQLDFIEFIRFSHVRI